MSKLLQETNDGILLEDGTSFLLTVLDPAALVGDIVAGMVMTADLTAPAAASPSSTLQNYMYVKVGDGMGTSERIR